MLVQKDADPCFENYRWIELHPRGAIVQAVVSASEVELLEVQGLGKKKAERIRWAVSERRMPYREAP